MKFDVVINTDEKYIQHTMGMLYSLYDKNIKHNITLHILSNDISEHIGIIRELAAKYNSIVKTYRVNEDILEGVQFRKNRPLTKAAYYRLLLSSIISKSIDRILYLDCDIIVNGDLSEIFDYDISEYALAASLDNSPYTDTHRKQLNLQVGDRTFCSGVMLVNLKYWRDNNVEVKLLEYAKKPRQIVYLHDQDVLNYIFKGRWFLLPPKWNRVAYDICPPNYYGYKKFDYIEYVFSPKLYHFADGIFKPWNKGYSPLKRKYIDSVRKSGFNELQFIDVPIIVKLRAWKLTVLLWIHKQILKIKYRKQC